MPGRMSELKTCTVSPWQGAPICLDCASCIRDEVIARIATARPTPIRAERRNRGFTSLAPPPAMKLGAESDIDVLFVDLYTIRGRHFSPANMSGNQGLIIHG